MSVCSSGGDRGESGVRSERRGMAGLLRAPLFFCGTHQAGRHYLSDGRRSPQPPDTPPAFARPRAYLRGFVWLARQLRGQWCAACGPARGAWRFFLATIGGSGPECLRLAHAHTLFRQLLPSAFALGEVIKTHSVQNVRRLGELNRRVINNLNAISPRVEEV
jgi:hypothetical protein